MFLFNSRKVFPTNTMSFLVGKVIFNSSDFIPTKELSREKPA